MKTHEQGLELSRWIQSLQDKVSHASLDVHVETEREFESARVCAVNEGVIEIEGQPDSTMALEQIVHFPDGTRGFIEKLGKRDGKIWGLVLPFNAQSVGVGMNVEIKRAFESVEVPVGRSLLGRIVDPLGNPLDAGGPIQGEEQRPVENAAPTFLDRENVSRSLETGLLGPDGNLPIGKGQRQLIIGDKETGRTTFAINTIINQRKKGVYCVYVAIGQDRSALAATNERLRKEGAMEYTTVVVADGNQIGLETIAPYSGATMGEFFRDRGEDALVVYDDLSAQAYAYRTLAHLSGRRKAREAYPADIFYLHARLLERAAQLSKARRGGSLTALPIIETILGKTSGYIPSNVISITDGQWIFDRGNFLAGKRPAIDYGQSVTRVGGDAQGKFMRSLSGDFGRNIAEYLANVQYSQFTGNLDENIRRIITRGQRIEQLMVQSVHDLYTLPQQYFLISAGSGDFLASVPLKDIAQWKKEFLAYIQARHPELMHALDVLPSDQMPTDQQKTEMDMCIQTFTKEFVAYHQS